MKVILQQDVKGHGKEGELVEVADGYARNYLLPRKLAVEANAANLNEMKTQAAARAHRAAQALAEAKEAAAKLANCTVKIAAKSGQNGRLFGAVTSKEISEALMAQHGVEINKNKLVLPEPIKSFGQYTIKAKLHSEVAADIKVAVGEE
ncbi:MAG TPA: 50S ribosomal protein L9 [Clostridiales bacterium]|nr:50S ribosomal protein L9 [Clostridiales bacterium]